MLLAWYALATHNGLTKLADAEDPSRGLVNFGAELRCDDAALQMAGIDTTQLSRCAAQSEIFKLDVASTIGFQAAFCSCV
jgi:hypothetical protein